MMIYIDFCVKNCKKDLTYLGLLNILLIRYVKYELKISEVL
jgi:hypothetical protein